MKKNDWVEIVVIVSTVILVLVFIFLAVWGIKVFVNFLSNIDIPEPDPVEWSCGKEIIDLEIICNDGRGGCSKKYTLRDGSVAFLADGSSRTNEKGQLCVRL